MGKVKKSSGFKSLKGTIENGETFTPRISDFSMNQNMYFEEGSNLSLLSELTVTILFEHEDADIEKSEMQKLQIIADIQTLLNTKYAKKENGLI